MSSFSFLADTILIATFSYFTYYSASMTAPNDPQPSMRTNLKPLWFKYFIAVVTSESLMLDIPFAKKELMVSISMNKVQFLLFLYSINSFVFFFLIKLMIYWILRADWFGIGQKYLIFRISIRKKKLRVILEIFLFSNK